MDCLEAEREFLMSTKKQRVAKSKQRNNRDVQEGRMSTGMNRAFIFAAVIALVLGVLGYGYFNEAANIENGLQNQLAGLGILGLSFVAAIIFAFLSQSGKDFVVFFREARIELRRVFWPSMSETRQMSILVVITMIIVMIFLMIVDALLSWFISFGFSG